MQRPLSILVATLVLAASSAVGVHANGAPAEVPTFAKDVAPILYEKCARCHRPGEIGPMSLMDYQSTRPWARSIRAKVASREMPPWAAAPTSMKMRNDASLSQEEIDTIEAWVEGGAPQGDDADMPPAPNFANGWQLGEPDYILEQPIEWTIRPDGAEPYLYFYQEVPFTEDQWASALELRPGNYAVVHHSGAYIVDIPEGYSVEGGYLYDQDGNQVPPSDPMGSAASTGENDPLAGANKLLSYVPGRGYETHPEGFAKRIPTGKYIRWVVHYNPTGQIETDRSRLGLWFAKGPVTHEVLNLQAGSPVPGSGGKGLYFSEGEELRYAATDTRRRPERPLIPPYEEAHRVMGITPVNEPVTLYSLTPHMHLRGKSMKWWVTYPDGREEVILDVPEYDFNWQLQYELETPLKIPAGSKITNVAVYDNSPRNRWNPAPEKPVYWSEQSWDEMYQPTTQFSVDSQDLTTMPAETTQEQER